MLNVDALPHDVRILWFGAHPDDELFVAPLLGRLRETKSARLHFVVATRGERGPCYRPEGCPDLAAVREQEMREAAAVFAAEAEFLEGCADGSAPLPGQVLDHWMKHVPDEQLRAAVGRFRPDLILTLDPDHGSTDHADHRAAGMLAAQTLDRDRLWFAETRVHWQERPMRFSSRDPEAQPFDCAPWWDYLLRDLACHRSQMREPTLDAFASVPENDRRVFLSTSPAPGRTRTSRGDARSRGRRSAARRRR